MRQKRIMHCFSQSSRQDSGSVLAIFSLLMLSAGVFGLLACKELTGSQQLPSGTQNPSFYSTPAGALGMRTAAIYTLEQAIPQFLVDAGLLTDELESNLTGASLFGSQGSNASSGGSLDERLLPEQSYGVSGTSADQDYTSMQTVRALTNQAVGALAAYDTGAIKQGDPTVMRGELYALQGYAEILLADFFCSGVPLSTLDFQKDWTYHAGSTADQVYQDAIAKEDSALALADTSTQVLNLARVLQGRALLDRGLFAQAAQAVAAVPETFQYALTVSFLPGSGNAINRLNRINQSATAADREGGTGLPYMSSGDPRTQITVTAVPVVGEGDVFVVPLTFPMKYSISLSGTGYAPFTVADGIEAQLIQAEAALQTNPTDPTWLNILNTLRATASVPGTSQPATAQQLPPLTDPGTSPGDTARVLLLFQERAYWMYVTGHRQGDLRRLIRQYGFRQTQVYPTGNYLAPGAGLYGSDVTAPIASAEYTNPLFQGCLNRGA